jgi:hypothetical protein
MGKLRILATTVLVAGALLPALGPGRLFNGDSNAPVAAMAAFRPLPSLQVDVAKMSDLEIARASLRAYMVTAQNKNDFSERAKASTRAFNADPTVRTAQEEERRAATSTSAARQSTLPGFECCRVC